jgi:hypothetical protein
MDVEIYLGVIYIMMKKAFTVMLGIACVIVLLIGQSYWKQQIAASAKDKAEVTEAVTPDQETNKKTDVTNFTKNWPESAVSQFSLAVEEDKAFRILFVGSPAIAETYDNLKKEMTHTYGKSIQMDLQTNELTSTQFIEDEKYEEVAAKESDMVVIEPFLLIDNGDVVIEESLDNLSTFVEAIKENNPDVTVILQPSFPLYNAKFYPVQVEKLKAYAEENQLTYLDHWSAWPDQKSEEIKEYLNEDQTAPSEKGLQVWSDYLVHYFIQQ